MQSKHLVLLAAAPAVLADLVPRQTPTPTASPEELELDALLECQDVFFNLLSSLTALSFPTDAAGDAVSVASISDVCSWRAAVPTSVQPQIDSYVSGLASIATAETGQLSSISNCVSLISQTGFPDLSRATECAGGSKNAAGPRETGAVVMGAAAAALAGVVGLL